MLDIKRASTQAHTCTRTCAHSHTHTHTHTHLLSQFPGNVLLVKYTTMKHREMQIILPPPPSPLLTPLAPSLPSCSSGNSDPNQFYSLPADSSQEPSQLTLTTTVLLRPTAHKSATTTNSTSNQPVSTLIVPKLSINLYLASPVFTYILFINY